MPPKGAGSWPLAGGRNSTSACTKGGNPNLQLWGAMWLFCLLPPEREGIATSANQVELLKIIDFFSPQQNPFFALVASRLTDTLLLTCPLGSLFILSVFTHLLLMCLQWLPTCLKGIGRMVRKGRKMEIQGLKKQRQGELIICTLYFKSLGKNWG